MGSHGMKYLASETHHSPAVCGSRVLILHGHTVFQHMRDTAHHSVADGCLSGWLSFQFRGAVNSAAR